MSKAKILRFERFELDAERGSVFAGDRPAKLRPKSFQLLQFMAENPGRLLSKSEILNHVWGHAQVTDDAVAQCVIDIRRALNDSDQSLIKTVPRRGYVLDAEPISKNASRKTSTIGLRVAVPVVLAVLAVAVVWWAVNDRSDSVTAMAEKSADSVTVAVLPFIDLSVEGDLGYFAEGVAEEIINLLTPVDDIRVIARTSSFSRSVRDADIETIQELLNVSHVLEGSVREHGGTVRVSVQLIDATNGERIWAQDYERQLGDVFVVQDQIAGKVLQRLAVQFQFPATVPYQPDERAYRLYLQALYILNSGGAGKLGDIEELITESLAIDPNFAPAWREYSRIWLRKIGAGHDPKAAVAAMDAALDKATKLDPHDAVNVAYRAWHAADFEGDLEKSGQLFISALAAEPANEDILRVAMRFVQAFGSPEDTLKLAKYSISTNPVCLVCYGNLAEAYERIQDFETAEATWRKLSTMFERSDAGDGLSLLFLGRADELLARHDEQTPQRQRLFEESLAFRSLGRLAESDEAVRQYVELTREEIPWGRAMLYAHTGRIDQSFEAIDEAVRRMQIVLDGQTLRFDLIRIGTMLRHPLYAPLHDDPRWERLRQQYGLVPPDLTKLSHLITRLDIDSSA